MFAARDRGIAGLADGERPNPANLLKTMIVRFDQPSIGAWRDQGPVKLQIEPVISDLVVGAFRGQHDLGDSVAIVARGGGAGQGGGFAFENRPHFVKLDDITVSRRRITRALRPSRAIRPDRSRPMMASRSDARLMPSCRAINSSTSRAPGFSRPSSMSCSIRRATRFDKVGMCSSERSVPTASRTSSIGKECPSTPQSVNRRPTAADRRRSTGFRRIAMVIYIECGNFDDPDNEPCQGKQRIRRRRTLRAAEGYVGRARKQGYARRIAGERRLRISPQRTAAGGTSWPRAPKCSNGLLPWARSWRRQSPPVGAGKAGARSLRPTWVPFGNRFAEGPDPRRLSHGRAIYAIVEEIIGAQPIWHRIFSISGPAFPDRNRSSLQLSLLRPEKPQSCDVLGADRPRSYRRRTAGHRRGFESIRRPVERCDIARCRRISAKAGRIREKVAEFCPRARQPVADRGLSARRHRGDEYVTCHGSLDNYTPDNRIRLSFDLRVSARERTAGRTLLGEKSDRDHRPRLCRARRGQTPGAELASEMSAGARTKPSRYGRRRPASTLHRPNARPRQRRLLDAGSSERYACCSRRI